MIFSFEEQKNESLVRELIGHNPVIFTFTVFMIFDAFLFLTFAFILFYSQMLIEKSIMPAIVIAIVGIFVFLISMTTYSVGKKKARRQVEILKSITENIINNSKDGNSIRN